MYVVVTSKVITITLIGKASLACSY